MTSFDDLPNETRLMIAEKLDVKSRRRFANTCRKNFHLLRRQTNKERYGIRGPAVTLQIHMVSSNACLIKTVQTDNGVPHDIKVYVLVRKDSTFVPATLARLLRECTVPKKEVTWIKCLNLQAYVSGMIRDANDSVDIEGTGYVVNYRTFNQQIARQLLQIGSRCQIVVFNDGFYRESIHNLLKDLLEEYVRLASSEEFSAVQSLSIREQYTRRCCLDTLEERSRILDSNARLMEGLIAERQMDITPFTYGQDVAHVEQTERRVDVRFKDNCLTHATATVLFDTEVNRPSCSFYGRQLSGEQDHLQVVDEIEVQQAKIEEQERCFVRLQEQIACFGTSESQQVKDKAASDLLKMGNELYDMQTRLEKLQERESAQSSRQIDPQQHSTTMYIPLARIM